MSIYCESDGGGQSQIASNVGWGQFGDWVETLNPTSFPLLHELWDGGVCEGPRQLERELAVARAESTPIEDVLHIIGMLMKFLSHEEDNSAVLSVTNGMGPDDGEPETPPPPAPEED